jgi:hypothetical protein
MSLERGLYWALASLRGFAEEVVHILGYLWQLCCSQRVLSETLRDMIARFGMLSQPYSTRFQYHETCILIR